MERCAWVERDGGVCTGRMAIRSGSREFTTAQAMRPWRIFLSLRGFIAGVNSAIRQRRGATLPPYFASREPGEATVRNGLRPAWRLESKGFIAMDHPIASARLWGRALAATASVAALTAALALPAAAQAQPKKPPAKPAAPAAQPAQPPQSTPAAPGQQGQGEPQLMYSPWMKVCGKGPDTNNKQVCVVTKDGRLENGMPVAIVQLFEPEGEQKVLRVTVPLGMQLAHGTRVIVDQNQPMQAPYKICFPVGCMADYPVTDDLIAKMKKGQ